MGNAESFHDLAEAPTEDTEKRKIPIQEILEKYLHKIFPKRPDMAEELHSMARTLEPKTEYLDFEVATEIATKDEEADALYIILEGDGDLLVPHGDNDQEDMLSLVGVHDVVGDVSLFFEIPCLHTVVVHDECCLLRIEATAVKKTNLPHLVQQHYKLDEWLVLRKQLAVPQIKDVNSKACIRKMISRMFRQVQLFSSWQTKQLDLLLKKMPTPLVEVYPIDAYIAGFGDRPRALILLVRGDAVAKDKFGNIITSLVVRRYPFCFGEEGLFVEDWHFPYSLSTLSTCQVVRVRLEDIEATTHAWLEQFPEHDTFQPWEISCDLWEGIKQVRDEEVHEKYIGQLQVEFVYRLLRQSGVLPLNVYSTRCIYSIAMAGQAVEAEEGKKLKPAADHIALVMVIAGKLGPVVKPPGTDLPDTWGPGKVIDCRNGLEATNLIVRKDPCAVVRFLEDDVRRIQAKFFRGKSFQ